MPDETPIDPKPSSAERRLIDAAFGQLDDRPDAAGGGGVPPDTFPGYEILRELHRGGQGVVYLAMQRATKRKVAVKLLHEGPFAGTAGRSRFEREVQILGQLSHPHIVRILDSGRTEGGSFFYVMDYVPGRSLDAFIGERELLPHSSTRSANRESRTSSTGSAALDPQSKRWAIDDVLRMFLHVCDAVNAAHLKGVIHRDLKPSNIRIDPNGSPVVVDFGLAKIALPSSDLESGRPMTMTGQFIGSLPWASPEQAEGMPDAIDVRTDVYSLGVILYQLLTGRFPYGVLGNMRDVLDNILRAEPAKPSSVRRQIDDEIETIVLKCLHKEKDRRYQSAGELARDIERYLTGEPIEAKRDSSWYVMSKTLSRHRGKVGVIAAFGVLVAFSAVGMGVLYARERDARRGESRQALAAQASGQRAARNADAGRELARSFMFEFNRDVSVLRGSTVARQKLLTRAKEYLGKIEADESDDPAVLRDLADAYDQMASIEGQLYMPRVGTAGASSEHTAKAGTIREGLLRRLPDDARSHADWARTLRQRANQAESAGRFTEASTLAQEAQTSLAKASSLSKDAVERGALDAESQRLALWSGDLLVRRAEAASAEADVAPLASAALDIYARVDTFWSAREAAGDKDASTVRATISSKKASMQVTLARASVRRGESALKKGAAASDPVVIGAFDSARATLATAVASARAAVASFDARAAAAGENAAAARDVAIALNHLGLALATSADIPRILRERVGGAAPDPAEAALRREALTHYERALSITKSIAEGDPKNLEARRDWAVALNKVGNEQRWLAAAGAPSGASGEWLAKALQSYGLSRDLRADLVRTDPMQRHTRDLGLSEFKLGQVHLALAKASSDPAARSASLRLAREATTRAKMAFQSLVDKPNEVMKPDSAEMVETAELEGEVSRQSENTR